MHVSDVDLLAHEKLRNAPPGGQIQVTGDGQLDDAQALALCHLPQR